MADEDETFWPPPPPHRRHPVRNVALGAAAVFVGMTMYGVIVGSPEADKADAETATTAAPATAAPSTTAKATTTTTTDEFTADFEWWNLTGEPALTDIEAQFDAMSQLPDYDFEGMTDACLNLSIASFRLQTAPDTEFGRHINAAGALYQQAGEACGEMNYDLSVALFTQAGDELDLALAALS